MTSFFVTGDEWGLVEIVPAENLGQYESVRHEITKHFRNTVFGPSGWTTRPFVLPKPKVRLAIRGISLARIEETFAGILVRADEVETCVDFTGPPFEAKDCYAWAAPPDFWAGIYGDASSGLVQTMYVGEVPFGIEMASGVAKGLARLGAEYGLFMVSRGSHIIDLQDRERIAAFLTNELFQGEAQIATCPDALSGGVSPAKRPWWKVW